MRSRHNETPSDHCPVVWTNGCYDILHVGHARLFEHCRELAQECGGVFVVGIDSDRRISQLKGKHRPINSQKDRQEMLMSVKGVHRVYIYDTAEELAHTIRMLSPLALVVGDEYRDKQVIGSEYCKSVVYFPKIDGVSSTQILSKLRG